MQWQTTNHILRTNPREKEYRINHRKSEQNKVDLMVRMSTSGCFLMAFPISATACLSRVKQYKAAKDRYFHLAASSVPLPFVLPVVPSLFSSSFYPPVGIRGPPSEGCKECPIPPACRALSSRGLLRTGTFISLRLLSHFLSRFLSSLPFPLHLLTYFFPY